MSKFSRVTAVSLLLTAAATPAFAQLQKGEKATAEQVATGEVFAKPISEAETVYRGLKGTMVARRWTVDAAQDLLGYLDRVGEEGLDPADYGVEPLRAALGGRDQAELDRAATDAFLRLSADLALGNVPMAARQSWHLKDTDLDGAQQFALMERAISNNSVRDTLNSLLPTHPQYTELKQVLANVSDATVKDKVRANLDRWRWLPRDLGQRYVIVNVPAYTVALVEDGSVVTRHKAVVGAPKTATPSLGATATGVIFNPWWEVPASITPEVRGKKGYVSVKTPEGGVRYRQPPGPGNALGRMKVVMPNNYAIYLHDTPSKALFKNKMRAYSHGCIRTEDPLAFAQILLGNPEWTKEKIAATIAEGKTVKAEATVATPVYITYFTAAAAANNKGIVEYKDIYARDGSVVTALNAKGATTTLASAK